MAFSLRSWQCGHVARQWQVCDVARHCGRIGQCWSDLERPKRPYYSTQPIACLERVDHVEILTNFRVSFPTSSLFQHHPQLPLIDRHCVTKNFSLCKELTHFTLLQSSVVHLKLSLFCLLLSRMTKSLSSSNTFFLFSMSDWRRRKTRAPPSNVQHAK